ncbi:MAG: hypothetical protein KME03_20405 [Aphanocapsa lilacina HA4352-LM1]|jgi:phosphoribulokinase|nr:hypothetical protein [Aphanocapsa lilacina HA4352-LM1]
MTNSVQFVCATARQQLKQLRSPIIVGVAGDSGSGKTTYSNGIRRLLGSDLVSTICFHSQLQCLAPDQFTGILPNPCYKVELILQPAPVPLPTLPLPFDLAAMLAVDQPPFMLAAVPCRYWGRSAIAIHLDGVLSQRTIAGLEDYIVNYTGIPLEEAIPEEQYELTSATRFAQLLITWRFLEQINYLLQRNSIVHF